MRPCTTCAHRDRRQIDAELLQGISLRTVASRHGLSASALHRHRAAHVDAPTVGDLLEPDDHGRTWCRWDGMAWLPFSSAPTGRPHRAARSDRRSTA